MPSIKEYLTHDHRRCDEAFAVMEGAVASGKAAPEAFGAFREAAERHFQMEERVMFPEFERKTGMQAGPTQVMRMEHQQMRSLMLQMAAALENGDSKKFFGLSETLMILMQQHNMKEEQMLYNMAQQHLGAESERIVMMMDAMIVE